MTLRTKARLYRERIYDVLMGAIKPQINTHFTCTSRMYSSQVSLSYNSRCDI